MVSGKASKAALELSEQVGGFAVDSAMLEPGRVVAINSGGLLSWLSVSVRCDRFVAPAVGGGPYTVLPTVGLVSERDDAVDVTAL